MFLAGNKSIPSHYTGAIIDDLSKTCDFIGTSYTICIQLTESNITECYKHPCGNGQVVTSLCGINNYPEDGIVSLQLKNGTENGTIISFFCIESDCSGDYSEVLLHNIEICKYKILGLSDLYLFFSVV